MSRDNIVGSVVAILTAIIGVAIIATLVSQKSATAQVIQAGSQGFSSILSTALSPVAGNALGTGVSALSSVF
jgi:hypothetical protein